MPGECAKQGVGKQYGQRDYAKQEQCFVKHAGQPAKNAGGRILASS
jgi:hypothetical protein